MNLLILTIGLLSQVCFSIRVIIQWFMSEKKKEVLSPTLFWVFSLMGSYLMFYYGWLRDDFSIIVGQFISFYIYIGNLKLKDVWSRVPLILRFILIITPPVIGLLCVYNDGKPFIDSFLKNDAIPVWLIVLGIVGQIVFTFRFIYQWIYSSRTHISSLPPAFWWISLAGSSIIVMYGVIRYDPILILGQSFGFASYIRNLMIGCKSKKMEKEIL